MMIWKIFFSLLFLSAWFGFIGPAMISSESDFLVVSWIVVTLGGLFFVVDRVIKKLKGKKNA
jgi:hypothetical protein